MYAPSMTSNHVMGGGPRPPAFPRRCSGLLFPKQTVNNSIPITLGETSRARAVNASAIRVRPLAHDHVVCLENKRAIK